MWEIKTSSVSARLDLIWLEAQRFLARFLSGDVLGKDKYAVFISYRHVEPDRHWAVWLHRALESFVIPVHCEAALTRGG